MADEAYFGSHMTVFDEAGRITVPKRFRELMERQDHITWYVTPGLNGNLYLYNRVQWNRFLERNRALYESTNQDTHRFFSFGYGCTAETHVDRQGRIPIAGHLRSLAGMEREVVLVGAQDRLELWCKDAWDAFCKEMWPNFGKRATELSASEKGGQDDGH